MGWKDFSFWLSTGVGGEKWKDDNGKQRFSVPSFLKKHIEYKGGALRLLFGLRECFFSFFCTVFVGVSSLL